MNSSASTPVKMTSTVKAKVDSHLKVEAENTLKGLGLDMTSALRMFLSQVVMKRAIPFEVALSEPNAETMRAIQDSYDGRVHSAESVDAIFDSIDE